MKALLLKISLIKKRKRIMRTLLVCKKMTYEQLHEMIQILFHLDCCEEYCFNINGKILQKDAKQSEKKTLIRIKEKDVFYYQYDLVDTLDFKIEVEKIVDSHDMALCIKAVGKNLYEGVGEFIEDKYQSKVDLKWINECLSYYNEDKQEMFYDEVRSLTTKLIQIRFFQDYMHNQIVELQLPQGRKVYMGCDASVDVILNFHINANKLMEYTSINYQATPQSVIKYHDCIELSLMKRSKVDEQFDFDFNVGPYGVFLSHANVFSNGIIPAVYMNVYLYALKRYINVMEYCQKNGVKFSLGKMLRMNEEGEITIGDGKMMIYNINFLGDEIANSIQEKYMKNDLEVEIDVLTLPKGIDGLETICIVGDAMNGYLESEIYCCSLKTMLAQIFILLQRRWEIIGMDRTFVLRDQNLKQVFGHLAKQFGIECRLENRLDGIDTKYLSKTNPVELKGMDPKEMVIRILEELGIDLNQIQINDSNELLEKIKSLKDNKKYS